MRVLVALVVVMATACVSSSDGGEPAGSDDPAVAGTVTVAAAATTTTAEPAPSPFEGTSVLVSGPGHSPDFTEALNQLLTAWADPQGITVEYRGDPDWDRSIALQVQAGAEPDIALFESTEPIRRFARAGALQPLPPGVSESIDRSYLPDVVGMARVDGTVYGVPLLHSPESIFWYQPGVWATKGYEVPQTFEEFTGLLSTMVAAGDTPLCLGLESSEPGDAPFAGWLGDLTLNLAPVELYDAWVRGEIATTDERIVSQLQALVDLWSVPGHVFGGTGLASESSGFDHAQDLHDQRCLMIRAGAGFGGALDAVSTVDGAPVTFADGSPQSYDVFGFPSNQGQPLQVRSSHAVAFADRPEVRAVLGYLASPDFVEGLLARSVTDHVSARADVAATELEPIQHSYLRVLGEATVIRPPLVESLSEPVGPIVIAEEGAALALGVRTPTEAATNIALGFSSPG